MPLKEYTYSDKFEVTNQVKNDFDEAGYIIVRGLLDTEELLKVKQALEGTDALLKHSFQINDSEGRKSRLCLWSHPGNDVTGMVGRCEKVAGTSEKLLGGEVYHYHTKLMMKEPFTGGEHVWHQDYGYWYKNGCLYPDMLTVFIAIDKCWKENGCLQILEGSHKCGRIEHVMVGGQTGADLERVDQLKKVLPLEFVELEPGDALFFHSNLLHNSAPNQSPYRRWAFLCAYNKASNNPVYEHHHPQYTPLKKVSNSAIKECTNITDMSEKDFMDPSQDKTIIVNKEVK
ncbi:ectoine dioxygenase [Biomphalaria glabrata]|uniref:L-proline trans-4-hydroxylase-like n=1 Tax=Biomphalaria glabrata TaxID=6526 RepID=A0A2C9L1H0_BIOGL|nr:L-proline trans-4-hydroxylase-like [Biomphalaria glabrata]KAI8732207.1 ectoine dioxygenase-like [Biomphalaria glabrata]KAI8750808.1 ectoine dioxygenase [Biomphalaria glabrata]